MKVTVDRDACCLYAQCVATAPDVFWIEDEELAYLDVPDESQRKLVEAAVAGCPAGAISMED